MHVERPSLIHTAPAWLWGAALLLLVAPVVNYALDLPLESPVAIAIQNCRTAAEGLLMLWAAGRRELSARTRLALRLPGYACLVVAGEQLTMAFGLATGWFTIAPGLDTAFTLASYLATLGLLLLPMAPLMREEWRTFALDILVSVGGLAALSWVIVTQPLNASIGGQSPSQMLLAYGIAEISHVAVLNVLVLRGLGVPSRRAVWLLIAAEASYLPVLWLAQYYEAGLLRSTLAIDLFYFGGEIPRLFAALAFRRDAMRAEPSRLLASFSSVNPFLLLTPLILAGMVANDRRIAYVQAGLAVLAFFVLHPRSTPSRRAAQLVLLASPFLVVYMAVGWSSSSRLFGPVQFVRNLVSPQRSDGSLDRSTLFRDIENFNLVHTARLNPIVGSGFGHPFESAVVGDQLPDFKEYGYLPHNSMVGLWAFTGPVGFTGIFISVIVAMFLAIRSQARARRPEQQMAATAALGCLMAYLIHLWADIGFTEAPTIVLVGLAMAISGQQALATGAWPAATDER